MFSVFRKTFSHTACFRWQVFVRATYSISKDNLTAKVTDKQLGVGNGPVLGRWEADFAEKDLWYS